jgi:cytochrome P450
MLDLLYSHPFLTLTLLIFLPFLYINISILLENRAIRRLGAFAPPVKARLPFSIDVVLRSISNATSNKDLDFWAWLFAWSPNKHSPTVEVSLARQRFIFTADPENIKAILATQFQDYGKGEPFHEDWKHFLGDSIFATDGDQWHNSRQLIRPQFVKNRVADLDIFEKHVRHLLSKIGGRGEEVDICALFYCFTLDSATDYLLGKSVDSLDDPNTEFASAFAEVQRVQNTIARAGPFNKLLPKGTFWAGLKVINDFVEPFIESVLRMNIADLKEKTNQSFLHALAATGTRDRKVIRDQVVAVLLAGRDTTAGALSFTFQELSNHPEIVQKLRREILERVGPMEAPTYEDLKNMPYLQHCMNETLRLYPSVPFNVSCDLVWGTAGEKADSIVGENVVA